MRFLPPSLKYTYTGTVSTPAENSAFCERNAIFVLLSLSPIPEKKSNPKK